MKVIMLSLYPVEEGTVWGGVMGVSYYLTRAMNELPGVEVEVVVPQSPFPKERTTKLDGVTVHYLPRRRGTMLRTLYGMPRDVHRKLAGMTFDLVHSQGYSYMATWLDCPTVLTIHGIAERDALFRRSFPRTRSWIVKRIETYGRKRIRNTIVISPYVRECLKDQLHGSTWDIENPVADSFFAIQRSPVPGRVLFGGLIIPRKNVKGLIEAFARTAQGDPQAHLRIAGRVLDRRYGQECMDAASQLGVSDRVEFLGNLSIEKMQQEMTQACCLALCSKQETAPVIIEEAMAAGLPVVAPDLCGVPYMVEDGATGRLIKPDDVQGVADAIRDVLQEQTNCAMSARSREVAASRFKASVVAQKTIDVYKTVLAGAS